MIVVSIFCSGRLVLTNDKRLEAETIPGFF